MLYPTAITTLVFMLFRHCVKKNNVNSYCDMLSVCVISVSCNKSDSEELC